MSLVPLCKSSRGMCGEVALRDLCLSRPDGSGSRASIGTVQDDEARRRRGALGESERVPELRLILQGGLEC